jgi:hypothetical protein
VHGSGFFCLYADKSKDTHVLDKSKDTHEALQIKHGVFPGVGVAIGVGGLINAWFSAMGFESQVQFLEYGGLVMQGQKMQVFEYLGSE